jgi:O-acetyl-ADP-ribose deacetylase (regulator of RNase III)
VLLVTTYLNCLAQLTENDLRTIAFPAISTGAYRFPLERATRLALQTIKSALDETPSIEKVIFCCFGERDFRMYERVAAELF